MGRTCSSPSMIYPSDAPSQSVRKSVSGCYQYGASSQDAECLTEAPDHLENEGKPVGKKTMKVKKVWRIEFSGFDLNGD